MIDEEIYDETHLGSTHPGNPLLLWLTVSADYHSGDKHDFAAYLKEFKHPYGGEDDNKVVALYVLGDDGPKAATWGVAPYAPYAAAGWGDLTITCAEYDVEVIKRIPGWC